jgi:hypothetical protein
MKEDKSFKFRQLPEVSEQRLRQIWNTRFSHKPFPTVHAIILEDKEFLGFLKRCNRETQIKEYGKIVPDELVHGCLWETPEGLLVIFVKSSFLDSLEEILEHELRHIYFEHYKKW